MVTNVKEEDQCMECNKLYSSISTTKYYENATAYIVRVNENDLLKFLQTVNH